jgi:NitT/TauT family transport system permease protein
VITAPDSLHDATTGDEDAAGSRWSWLWLAPVVGVVVFLGLWELLVWAFGIERFVLPGPWSIVQHLAGDPGFYVRNARTTLWEAFLGFVLAFVAAMAAAMVMARSRFVERAVLPLAVLIQVTPIIAYAPAVVIWLGFGLKPILVLTSLVCFVPFLFNGVAGLRSVDPLLVELARSVDASEREVLLRLRLPSSLPFLFSAARINVGLALIGAVLGEFFAGSTGGLGYAVKVAQSRNLIDQLWGSIFALAILGSLATLLITALEGVVLRWHPSQR